MSHTKLSIAPDQLQAFVSQLGVVSDRELSRRYGVTTYYVLVEREARDIPAFSHSYVFPVEAEALLGKILDTEIVARFSIPLGTVHRHRVALGLPRVKNPPLPEAAISLLGTCPDTRIADQFSVTLYQISEARKVLGIACFKKPKAQSNTPAIPIRNLPAEAISLLGTMSDRKIALRFGVSDTHVAAHRSARGIAAYKISRGKNQTTWSSDQIALLGTIPDQDVADRLGISVKLVYAERRKRGVAFINSKSNWTKELLALLGTIPDTEVAARSNGLFRTSGVRSKRVKEGIAPCRMSKSYTTTAWTSDKIALIGTLPDQDVADQIGVPRQQVSSRRRKMGMAPIKSQIKWPSELLALLGAIPDTEIAARSKGLFGITLVREKRREEGIAPCPKGIFNRKSRWTTDLLALLGTIPDSEVAARSNGLFSPGGVHRKREREGIAPCPKHQHKRNREECKPKLPPEALALLGKVRDTDIAAQFSLPYVFVVRTRMAMGVPRASIKAEDKLTSEAISQLGKFSDAEIARRFGLTVYFISNARISLEIPAFERPKQDPKKKPYKSVSLKPQRVWTPEEIALLGTISDSKLEEMTGISLAACAYKRYKLGIAPFRDHKWTPELTALLGKVPDAEVVKKSNGLFNIKGVRKKRSQLGIAVCPAPKIEGTGGQAALPEVMENLGKISDYEIARRTGVDRASITRQRQKLGIKAVPRGRKPREWTAEEEALLGKFSDVEIGRKLGIAHNTVSAKRKSLNIPIAAGTNFWTVARNALLGTMVDSALAQQLGCSFWEIYERRKMLGIPPFEFSYSGAQQDQIS